MNLKSLMVFVFGLAGFILLGASKVIDSFPVISLISMSLALIGSFLGLWNLISLLFKNLTLSSKDKTFLIIGLILSLVSFSFARYGFIIIFWLPGAIVSLVVLRLIINSLNKATGSVINPLQNKINQMEEQIDKNKQTTTQ